MNITRKRGVQGVIAILVCRGRGRACTRRSIRPRALREQLDRIFTEHAYDPPRFGPAMWLPDGTAYSILEKSAGAAAGSEIALLRCRHGRANRPRAGVAARRAWGDALRHRRIRLVERRPKAAHLHQYEESLARQHPRRLLGPRRGQRRAEETRRQGARVVADVRQVLARWDARRVRPRQQHPRRTPERRRDDHAHPRRIRDDDQRHVGLGLRRGAGPARRLPLEPGRTPDRVLAVRFDRRRHLLADRRHDRRLPEGHADSVSQGRDDELRRCGSV